MQSLTFDEAHDSKGVKGPSFDFLTAMSFPNRHQFQNL